MSIDRNRRVTFEETADLYDEVRQGYPEELVDDVIALSKIPPDGRILEIGCGTGNATVSFAKRGYQILAIELGEELAARAAKNCREYPGVKILNMPFEEWEVEPKTFDLAVSADAFHWTHQRLDIPKLPRL
jgi:SAM-dependent methyltransferase